MTVSADFNNDAIPDIAAPISGTNTIAIVLGKSGGGFETPREFFVGVSPQEAITGDFNRDGETDLAVTSEVDQQLNILVGDGAGNFVVDNTYPVGGAPGRLDKGDFNNDGWLDLIVANTSFPNRGLTVYFGGPNGLTPPPVPNIATTETPIAVRTADFNLDGKLDFAVALRVPGLNAQVLVYTGDGLGGFTLSATLTTPEMYSMDIADFDEDGSTDIVSPSSRDNFARVFLNNHAGGFAAPRLVPALPTLSALATDVNGDGHVDIVNGNSVLVNDGAANFTRTPVDYTIGGAPADYNGDGIVDFAFSSGISTAFDVDSYYTIGIAYGRGDLSFSASVAVSWLGGSTNAVIADFNGDGRKDIAGALGGSIGVRLVLQNADGSFTQSPTNPYNGSGTANQISNVIAADVNGDGAMDLISHVNWSRSLIVMTNNGAGQFTVSSYSPNITFAITPRYIDTGDFNGDGKLDILLGEQGVFTVYVNNGSGAFTQLAPVLISGQNGNAVAVADYDTDGKLDFMMSRGNAPMFFYRGNGDGTFTIANQFVMSNFVRSLRANDLNADGRADLVLVASTNSPSATGLVQIMLNQVNGTFNSTTVPLPSTSATDLKFGDFNGDTKSDFVVFNSPSTFVSMFAGDGLGGFASPVSSPGSANMYAGGVGDLNADGLDEIAVGGTFGGFVFMYNETPTGPCLSVPDVTVAEGDTGVVNAEFNVSLSASSSQTVTVDYRVVARNAQNGADFTAATGNLEFLPGTTSRTVQIPVAGDLLDEDNETFQFVLSNPVNASVIDPVATATIADNDLPPSLSIADVSVVEGTGAVPTRIAVNVGLSAVSGRRSKFGYSLRDGTAVAGADFAPLAGSLVLLPGQSTAQIMIDIAADAFVEPDETFSVLLTDPTNLTIPDNESAVSILNDDVGGSVQFSASSVTASESDDTATLTVSRTGGAAAGVVVAYAVSGGSATPNRDFLSVSGKLYFAAGESTKTIVVPLLDDVVDELPIETIEFSLTEIFGGGVLGAQRTAVIEVGDDDSAPAISASDISVTELNSGSTTATFTIQLRSVSDLSVSVGYTTANGTAVAPGDYASVSGTLTFAPGETTKTISVTVVGDRSREPNETFFLDFSAPVNAVLTTTRAAATILNDDNGPSIADFDGDGLTDLSIFRPTVGEWWYSRSIDGQVPAVQFGTPGDKVAYGDFTGDGKTDITFWRPSTGEWFVLRSEDSSYFSFPFGATGDIPATGDYDGDGKSDAAVYRPSTGTWFIQNSSGSGVSILQFGSAEDKPVNADFDGDGKSDIAIFRPSDGSWWYLRSSDGAFRVFRFGVGTDRPVPGDFTGDGKADIAVFRPSTGEWFVQRSEDNSYFSFPFGATGDIAVPGDYDGDGKFDAGVFRPSTATWFVNRTTAGVLIATFGANGDVPLPGSIIQ